MYRYIKSHPYKSIFILLISLCLLHVLNRSLSSKIYVINWGNFEIPQWNNNINETFDDMKNISFEKACEVDISKLESQLKVDRTPHTFTELEKAPWAQNVENGSWSPQKCDAKYSIAIIIPYRNREQHLKIFLNHFHPFLQKQLIKYTIYVIEQATGTRFNRAALFNVGYKESTAKNKNIDCFIFHDVDLIPTNNRNMYQCKENPIHFSVAIDKYNYKLPYNTIFGGAGGFTKSQFQKVNGFSNIFYGWGGEDDDMYRRLIANNMNIVRYPTSISRYEMIKHSSDKGNPENPTRFALLRNVKSRYKSDGLSSLEYQLISRNSSSKLYQHITVQFNEKAILKKWKIN